MRPDKEDWLGTIPPPVMAMLVAVGWLGAIITLAFESLIIIGWVGGIHHVFMMVARLLQ